ncbi:MAG: polysaccharide deacetylase family protein [Candidatus Promineifilaceae bacterium]
MADGWPVAAMEAEPEGATHPRTTLPPGKVVSEATEPVPGLEGIAMPTVTETPNSSADAALPEPLPTPVGVYSLSVKVPILMYHYISQPPEGADIYRQDLSVSPEAFRAQMQFLIDNGYTAIGLEDLSLAVVGKRVLPARPVIITVDDGYRDNYENAFPILRDLGLQATFFIATDFVDRNNQEYMSWAMIEEMAAAGMRFEPHSKSHVDLPGRSRAFLIWEILGSRDTLEAHLGGQPRYFAYPSGRYDDAAVQIVQELGFWGAVTTQDGRWHGYNDRFLWKRVRMRYTTTLEMLPALLDGQGE